MGDVLDAVSARIKAPYFGYAVLAFIAWNWRGLFLLVISDGTPEERLAVFDLHTTVWSMYLAPLLTGFLVAATAEWMSFGFEWISRKPLYWKEMNLLETEHQKLIAAAVLERSRNERFARKEEELIARAQRDEKVKEINDEELKKKLEQELDSLRNEQTKSEIRETREDESSSLPSEFAQKLLTAAAKVDGRISIAPGELIRAGFMDIYKTNSPRDYSRFDTALKELCLGDLVNETYEGVYEITAKGWQFLDFAEAEL